MLSFSHSRSRPHFRPPMRSELYHAVMGATNYPRGRWRPQETSVLGAAKWRHAPLRSRADPLLYNRSALWRSPGTSGEGGGAGWRLRSRFALLARLFRDAPLRQLSVSGSPLPLYFLYRGSPTELVGYLRCSSTCTEPDVAALRKVY